MSPQMLGCLARIIGLLYAPPGLHSEPKISAEPCRPVEVSYPRKRSAEPIDYHTVGRELVKINLDHGVAQSISRIHP